MDIPDINALLDDSFARAGEPRWPTYLGGRLDRSQYVTSSEVGNCPRRIKYGKLKPQGRLTRWGYAQRGHLIERWATSLIRSQLHHERSDWTLLFSGDAQLSFYDGNQSGTPDGLLLHVPTSKGLCLEVKSVDPRSNYDNLPKRVHVSQTLQNIDLFNRCTSYEVHGGLLWYIDASDLQRRKLEPIQRHEATIETLRRKADAIMAASCPSELDATGLYTGECSLCDHTDECNALIRVQREEETGKPEVSPDLDAKIERAMSNVFKRR